MTDDPDLDRRIRREIAAAMRLVGLQTHFLITERMNAVADSLDPPEPPLLPCPFCGKPPEKNQDCVRCNGQMDECPIHDTWMTVEEWNRREVPHG